MPQPSAPRRTPAVDRASAEPTVAAQAKAPDLTVNKVLAGAAAAATSAVIGSFFGATGTVAGAALGSVASTVATTLYQRSLDRTRDTIVARVRLTGARKADVSDAPTVELTLPQPRLPIDAATTQLRVAPVLRRPRRVWVWVGATVLAFVIALVVVTGLEWAKGSSLTTGQPGTSVGRVLTPGPGGSGGPAEAEETDEAEPTASAEPTAESEPSDDPAPSAEATPSEDPDRRPEATRERPSGTPTATPQPSSASPTPEPEPEAEPAG